MLKLSDSADDWQPGEAKPIAVVWKSVKNHLLIIWEPFGAALPSRLQIACKSSANRLQIACESLSVKR